MSWFDKMFGLPKEVKAPPTSREIEYYDEETKASFHRIEAAVERMFASEAEALKRYGLPVPTIELPTHIYADYQQPRNNAQAVLSAFDIPPHRIYTAHRLSEYDQYRSIDCAFGTEHQSTHCLFGEGRDLDAIIRDTPATGDPYVLTHNPGHWFNRDPYAFFKRLHSDFHNLTNRIIKTKDERHPYSMGGLYGDVFHAWPAVTKWTIRPLELLPAHEIERARQVSRWQHFSKQLSRHLQADIIIPVETFIKVPLPKLTISSDYVRLKILPTAETKAAMCAQFFDNLKRATAPLVFAFVATDEAMYYELSCAPADKAAVLHQLNIHFPEFAVSEHTAPPHHRQHVLTAAVRVPCLSLKLISDFVIDPYTQLIAQLTDVHGDDCVRLEIVFTPLPERILGSLLDSNLRECGNSQAVNTVRHKAPGWMCAFRIEASSPALLRQIEHTFLAQYATTDQCWETLVEAKPT